MSSALFRIDEHEIPCQYIRQYPRALAKDEEDDLRLAIKQYTPHDNPNPKRGDVTIIGCHANAFPKELYEPLWDELLREMNKRGLRIRSIWAADVAHQGASGVLNERKMGFDVSWFDHARDLLHMINHFRAQMPRPIAGIGHSMGGANLINLSLIHPRLLQTLILIDPVVQRQAKGANAATQASTFRRDIWPSRQEAAKAFGNSKFYRAWDGRVLDRWMQYGLRELPTIIHPDANTTRAPNATPPMPTSVSSRTSAPYARGRPPQESALTEAAANFIPSASPTTRPATSDAKKAVTLTTPKHFELHTFARRNFEGHRRTDASNRHTHPDIPPHAEGQEHQPFYRPEPFITFANLPFLRPSVLYVFGETSEMSTAALRREKMEVTGTGLSGSGGAEQGRVKEVVIEGTGHLVPMEKVGETAGAAAHWLELEMALWRETEERESREWRDSATSLREKQMVGHEWVRKMSEGMKNGKAKL